MVTSILLLTSCVLLALVGGFLLMVWQQLRAFRQEALRMPALGNELMNHLVEARKGLEVLRGQSQSLLPEIQREIAEVQGHRQDLQYLNARAEALCKVLEQHATRPPALAVREAQPLALVAADEPDAGLLGAEVAQSNQAGVAFTQTEAPRTPDPLEQLLATLAQSELVKKPEPDALANNIVKLPSQAKRSKPRVVAQAELDLKKSLAG